MSHVERLNQHVNALRALSQAGPRHESQITAAGVLDDLLQEIPVPKLPVTLYRATHSCLDDYLANWNHQLWFHIGELLRIHEGRDDRRDAQGPDRWTAAPRPSPEVELMSQLRELQKLRFLISTPPTLIPTTAGRVVFDDRNLEKPDAWEQAPELVMERDSENGAAWKGQNPGGDWLWVRTPFPDGVVIENQFHPLSTIKGGLIIAFACTPHDGVAFSTASGPRMRDYYSNFECYHFSVHRGSTGFCNLRRCGPGLVMLASFDDPCPAKQWYSLQIVKAGPQVELRVEGKLICCYIDLGNITPTLGSGHFGLRHFQGFYGWERNVRVRQLEPVP